MLKKLKGYAYTAAAYVIVFPAVVPLWMIWAIEWCFKDRDWVYNYVEFAERLAVKGDRLRA